MTPAFIWVIIGLIEIILYYIFAYSMKIAKQKSLFQHNHVSNPFLFQGTISNIIWYTLLITKDLYYILAIIHIIFGIGLGIITIIQLIFNTRFKKAIIIESIAFACELIVIIPICVYMQNSELPLNIIAFIFGVFYSFHTMVKSSLISSRISTEPFLWWEPMIIAGGCAIIGIGGCLDQTFSYLYVASWFCGCASGVYSVIVMALTVIGKNIKKAEKEMNTEENMIKEENKNVQQQVSTNKKNDFAVEPQIITKHKSEDEISFESNTKQALDIHRERPLMDSRA